MKPLLFVSVALPFFLGSLFGQDWAEITGLPQGRIPAPASGPVNWRSDLDLAFQEAQQSNRPMLVTWRCLPCKQCAEFDKTVLDGSPSLTPLLQRFVTVRMTDAAFLDQRTFPYLQYQDLDLSWWAYFLNPEGRIYGVFGGKDHLSDATRISEPALVNSLKRVLAHHYDPRRESWNIDGPLPDLSEKPQTPKDHPAIAAFAEKRPHFASQACIHCHQVTDIENFGAMEDGTFDLKTFSQPWPFPENIGLEVDRDDGLKVTNVFPGGAAEQVGIKIGDSLVMAENQKLFGQADLRGVLHRAPFGEATIRVGWDRDGKFASGKLDLADGWRKSDISWRKSVYDGVVGYGFGFFPLKGPNQGKGSMSFRPFMGKDPKQNPWFAQGLRPNMEITAVNGKSDDWHTRQLLTWLRLNHGEGDKVTIRVKNGSEYSLMLPVR